MTRQRAVGELVLAGALWGFGFVATIWVLAELTPTELLVSRYLIATLVGELIWWLMLRGRGDRGHWLRDFKLALPAGLLMAAFIFPQTLGLKYTSASKSGFLTTFYVILVPLFNRVFFKTPIRASRYGHATLAIFGAALLMGADASMNPGDWLTLLCAALAAVHILYIERISQRIDNPFRFNTFQSFFALVGVAPLLFTQDGFKWWPADPKAIAGLLMLAIASSVIAFTIQIRTQKILSSATASMLFLLESPFALFFGILLLRESLSPAQGVGAVMILTAALLSARAG